MNDELYVARNDALEFARRTRKNLEYIEESRVKDVHVVTQLVNSLLGLVVFLKERQFVEHIKKLPLEKLMKDGWPQIRVTRGECNTLGDLVRHLRNAIAHGRLKFSSDSRNINEVDIRVEDYKRGQSTPCWCAMLNAGDLREFCAKLVDLLEDTTG